MLMLGSLNTHTVCGVATRTPLTPSVLPGESILSLLLVTPPEDNNDLPLFYQVFFGGFLVCARFCSCELTRGVTRANCGCGDGDNSYSALLGLWTRSLNLCRCFTLLSRSFIATGMHSRSPRCWVSRGTLIVVGSPRRHVTYRGIVHLHRLQARVLIVLQYDVGASWGWTQECFVLFGG